VGVAALVVVLLGTCGWVIGRELTSSSAAHHRHPTAAAPSFASFKDPSGLFQGDYPSTWKRVQTGNPSIVLLAQGPNGASYLVQKSTVTAPVGLANLAAAKKFTDRVVHSGSQVKLLRPPIELTLGGLPGFLYLYTFADPSTGDIGAHAHYFLFDGKTVITLVFQSLPSNTFEAEAPLFDQIAKTFTVNRR
jgi:hypothetical protein